MIRRLKATDYPALYRLQQSAYHVEAQRIGAVFFPPLQQTAAQLSREQPAGYVYCLGERVAGAVTIDEETITRLVVSPDHFRQGIASQLLRHALKRHPLRFVSTAAANHPALALYQQFGFRPIHQVRRDSIVLVTLERR